VKFSRSLQKREAPRSAAFLDVLFILLITFFLVTSLAEEESRSEEPRIEVRLPALERGEPSAARGVDETLRLVLFGDGRLAADEALLGAGTDALRELERVIAQRKAAGEPALARLYADEGSRAQHLLPVLALLREPGFERLDLHGRAASAAEETR
jgi:biopolymer transport protein ExbD